MVNFFFSHAFNSKLCKIFIKCPTSISGCYKRYRDEFILICCSIMIIVIPNKWFIFRMFILRIFPTKIALPISRFRPISNQIYGWQTFHKSSVFRCILKYSSIFTHIFSPLKGWFCTHAPSGVEPAWFVDSNHAAPARANRHPIGDSSGFRSHYLQRDRLAFSRVNYGAMVGLRSPNRTSDYEFVLKCTNKFSDPTGKMVLLKAVLSREPNLQIEDHQFCYKRHMVE